MTRPRAGSAKPSVSPARDRGGRRCPRRPRRKPHSLHVLVVDDDQLIVDAVSRALVAVGCVVTTATSVSGAREAMTTDGLELVVCDWNVDGERTDSLLREMEAALPKVKKILMTGSPSAEWAGLVKTGVVRAALPKPFGIGELLRAVKPGGD